MAKKQQTSAKDAGKSASKNAQLSKQKAAKTKGKKKSWTKVKVKEKMNNAVYLDKAQYDRMCKEVPKILCITRAVLIEKFKIGGAVARAFLNDMVAKDQVWQLYKQSKFELYRGKESKTAAEKAEIEKAEAEAKAAKKGKKKE